MTTKKSSFRPLFLIAFAVLTLGAAMLHQTVKARELRTVPIPGAVEKAALTCMGTPVSDFYEDSGERLIVIAAFNECGGMSTYAQVMGIRRVVQTRLLQFLLFTPANDTVFASGPTPVKAGDYVRIPDFIGYQVGLGKTSFLATPVLDESWVTAQVIGQSPVSVRTCHISGCSTTAGSAGFYTIDHATSAWPGSAAFDELGNLAGLIVGSDTASGRTLVMGAEAIWGALNEAGLVQKGRSAPVLGQQ